MFAFKVANCNLDKQKLELRLLALKCAIKQNQEVIDIFCCYLVAMYLSLHHSFGIGVSETRLTIFTDFFVDKHSRTLWLMDKKRFILPLEP